jgi:N-acetylmuramoyl-L-alanine amidase
MIFLLDNGHGALINQEYQTPGKRSPVWANGSQLFEGEFNRAIVNRIIDQLSILNIPYVNIAPEYWDVSLKTRVNRANEYPGNSSFYISVHSNAGGGSGSEIFTSPGNTKSDEFATVFGEEFKVEFPTERLRTDFSDGDLDKEAKFYVLTKTRMPAILTENFFMDNETECKKYLMTRDGRDRLAKYHVNAIQRIFAL